MKKLFGLILMAMSIAAYADGAAPAPSQPSMGPMLIFFVVMILIIYFGFIRPQSKRQKEQQRIVAALEKGDEVVTVAGLYGKVVSASDTTTVDVEVAKGVVVKMQKQAISSLIPKGTLKNTTGGDVAAEAADTPKKAKTVAKKAK